MKKILAILSLLILIVISCSKDDATPTTNPISNPVIPPNIDTIVPYSSSNCCDTTYIYIGQIDTAIKLIPNIITPNGDGYNDAFYLGFTSPISQVLTLEIRDSLGILLYEQGNYGSSGNYFEGAENTGNASFNTPYGTSIHFRGSYSAKLYSSTWSVEFMLCISDVYCTQNVCPSCEPIDTNDPYIP